MTASIGRVYSPPRITEMTSRVSKVSFQNVIKAQTGSTQRYYDIHSSMVPPRRVKAQTAGIHRFQEKLAELREKDARPTMAPPRRGRAQDADIRQFEGRLTQLQDRVRGLLDQSNGQSVQGGQLTHTLRLIEQLQASQRK